MRNNDPLITGAIVMALLSGCTQTNEIDQANGQFDYTQVEKLTPLVQDTKTGRIPTTRNYLISNQPVYGNVGENLDIRPPVQTLNLIPYSRSYTRNNKVFVQVTTSAQLEDAWRSIKRGIQFENQTQAEDEASNRLNLRVNNDRLIETDWVNLNQSIDNHILVRYRVEKQDTSLQKGLLISIIAWKNADDQPVVPTDVMKTRYVNTVSNNVMSFYSGEKTRETQRKAQARLRAIPMQMGVDTSALPIIIARIPFNMLWARLPSILPLLGMQIDDRTQSQGLISIVYNEPDDESWDRLGISRWALDGYDYQIHLGDLQNRTSISLTDKEGKPVAKEIQESFMAGLQAAVKYNNEHPVLKK